MRLAFLSTFIVLFAHYAPAAPAIDMVRATPVTAVIGTPTQITVQASITDSSLIANGINLLQLNPDGTTTILGTLHDDGLNGDLLAGDLIFTTVINLNQSSASQINLQVSAAFRGVFQRVKSPVLSVFFQTADAPRQALNALASNLATGNLSSALTYINPSSNAATVLGAANPQTRNLLASLLNSAILIGSGPDSRIFQMPIAVAKGGIANMEFDMVPDVNGQWVINSW